MKLRIGQGYDIHQLVEGRNLMLGGIKIDSAKGSLGHSDGDALLHAIIDALLGAAALGDIGKHFPPSDNRYKDIESLKLLGETHSLLKSQGYEIINIDTTIILEKPKLRPHIEPIRRSIADNLGLALDAVSVKAKTNEKQDAAGHEQAVVCQAVVLICQGAMPASKD